MLRVARRLGESSPVTVTTTFLGAHALPPEYTNNRSGYIDLVCNEMLPKLHAEGLIDAVDAFCESIAFSAMKLNRSFKRPPIWDYRSNCMPSSYLTSGGAALAAKIYALSADHLEYLDETACRLWLLAAASPCYYLGAFYMLRETQKPPVQLLRDLPSTHRLSH